MASSMPNGERRWGSARKSGMTVLGKVPKPINLPSQRLENHGLDPNVEIVPKGTLTWGSRPSSNFQNAWGSSPQSSPNTDGGIGSPSYLDRHPSSGGSGRPSTAGSDRSFEPGNSAWTSNSRPSSASGILASNQSSTMTRPRSAETRSGSSQLSRFAKPIPENSVPRDPGVTVESPRHGSSKMNDFTLTSGDFPTLGSEKNSELNAQPGRPSSAQGSTRTQKEEIEVSPRGDDAVNTLSEKEMANTWKKDTQHAGVGASPDIDNSHRDSHSAHSYSNMNIPQQHINTWHGSPVHNPPDGIWYRGVPPAGPYRPMGSHGNYPMEAFPYYPSQPPARPAPNSQSDPRAGAILGGYPHKNGESFRPQMPSDSYMFVPAPVIPVRPGIFPGQVPYDGYYGPRPSMETPVTGMTVGHDNFNQYQNQHTTRETENVHPRSSGFVGSGVDHHLEPAHHHKPHGGQYRALLKQPGGCVVNATNHKRGHISVGCNIPDLGRAKQTETMMKNGDREEKNIKDELEVVEGYFDAPINDLEGKMVDDNHVKTGGTADSYSNKKNVVLIGKVQGISNNTQITDGCSEAPFSAKRESTRGIKNKNVEVNIIAGSKKSNAVSFGNVFSSIEKGNEELEKQSLRDVSSFQNKTNMVKKSSKAGFQSSPVSSEFTNQQIMHITNNVVDGSSSFNSTDYKSQMATLRAKQLQKEEERINEQRSKALAKLEELNIRTSGESSNKNVNHTPPPNDALDPVINRASKPDASISHESLLPASASGVELLQKNGSPKFRRDGLIKPGGLSLEKMNEHGSSKHGQESNTILVSDRGVNRPEISNIVKSKKIHGGNKLAITQERSPFNSEATAHTSLSSDPIEFSSQKTISQGIVSKQRQMGHKRRQNAQQEKNLSESSISPVDRVSFEVIQQSVSQGVLVANDLANYSKDAGDMLVQNKKKNNRGILSKNMTEKVPPVSSLPMQHDAGIQENTPESVKTKPLESFSVSVSVAAQVSQGDSAKSHSPIKSSSQNLFMGIGDNHGKPNNQWKPHPSRRTARNAQYRPVDKVHGTEVVWAPVKPFEKSESSVLPSNSTTEVSIHSTAENGNVVPSNMKSKRAEMERYVPKVAKKLSGQATHTPSDHYQAPPVDATSNSDIGSSLSNSDGWGSAVKESELMTVKKNWDHGRPGKNQTSWRLRNSHEGASLSDATETVSQSFDANQTSMLEVTISHPFPSSDVEKGTTHRGKSQTHKVHKAAGTSHHTISDGKNFVSGSLGKSETQSPLESNDGFDGKSTLKNENRNFGEHTRSHWKPKSQAYSSHNRGIEGQRVVSQFGVDIDSQIQVTNSHQLENVEDKNNGAQGSVILEARSTDHHETRRQRKFITGSLKDKVDLPNKNLLNTSEQDYIQGETQQGWTDSGRARQGQHNRRFYRDQENNHVGSRGSGQASGDRSRHAPHYEYQKVEFQNKTTPDSGEQLNIEVSEEPKDGFHKRGQFYRGRGQQNQMRRGGVGGHFYARNSGRPARAGYTHDNRE